MKKFFKYTAFALIGMLIILTIFRGWMYRQFFSYKNIGNRTEYSITDKQLQDYIDKEISADKPTDISDVIKLSLRITSGILNFTDGKNAINPNKLYYSTNAHCIGYSAFFSATCNYVLAKTNLTQWHSEPLIGKIHFLGINIHPYFNTPFLNDHDFNVIENTSGTEKYYVDPTLHDYSGIYYVSMKSE